MTRRNNRRAGQKTASPTRRRVFGRVLAAIGLFMIIAAALILCRQYYLDKNSADMMEDLLSELEEMIPDEPGIAAERIDHSNGQTVSVLQVDGVNCAGVLSADSIDKKWPVGSQDESIDDLPSLRTAAAKDEAYLTIVGSDSPGQFSPLTQLTKGDAVNFTDVNGITYHYTVVFAGTETDLKAFVNHDAAETDTVQETDGTGQADSENCIFDLELRVSTSSIHPLIIGCREK